MRFHTEVLVGKVRSCYRSAHLDSEYDQPGYMLTKPEDQLTIDLKGVQGDRHYGFEAVAGGRMKKQYPKGEIFRNRRQWSAISLEELERIGKNLDLKITIDELARILGNNFLIDGIPNISELGLSGEFRAEGSDIILQPGKKYLVFSPHDGFTPCRPEDVTLEVHGAMMPCKYQGQGIAAYCRITDEDFPSKFPGAAMHNKNPARGITGTVERGGIIKPGFFVYVRSATGRD